MPPVRIANRHLWIGDEPHALLSGEIHAWRLAPAVWRDALRRARDLGLEMIASYVCWDFHEIAPGEFDFRGETDPRRDLPAFLDLVAEEKLWLLIRPGPYIYAEWRNGGLPDRVVPYPRLHPVFQDAAAQYMAAVVEVLRPYLATHGGPIVLLQAENETDPWPQYYEQALGLGSEPGPFHAFLRQRYGDIAALNDAWETRLETFEQARAVTQPTLHAQRGYRNRYLDFWRFRHWHAAETVRWTVDQYRALGVDVPIYTNTYNLYDIQNWRDLEAVSDLAGADFYPTPEFRQGADEHRTFLHQLRYHRTFSALPYIPEFEAGIWDGGAQTQGFSGNHYLLACCSALLAGIVGWNWYMLVNRDNWLLSPINENARPRLDVFRAFASIIRLFRQIDPPRLEKITGTAASVDVLQRTARLPDAGDEVLQALYDAGIDYDCTDLSTGRLRRPLLFYAGGDWLSEAGQQQLVDYVREGGHLVCFQHVPVQDDSFRPLNLLGFYQPVGILGAGAPQRLCVEWGDNHVTLSSPAFFVYHTVPGMPVYAERVPDLITGSDELEPHTAVPVGQRYVIGYHEAFGQGTITCLGVQPTPALLRAIHRWLGVPIPSRSDLPGVSTALFRRDETYFLVAVNNGSEDRDARVELDPALFEGEDWTGRDLLDGTLRRVTVEDESCALTVHLPRKNGTVIEINRAAS